MCISDWSSDVCSSDLIYRRAARLMDAIATTQVRWQPCYRIVASRFPPISLFEDVADPADLEAVYAIEAMTKDRLRDEVGALALAPPEERVSGPGTSELQQAVPHPHPAGRRFRAGSFGRLTAATPTAQRT